MAQLPRGHKCVPPLGLLERIAVALGTKVSAIYFSPRRLAVRHDPQLGNLKMLGFASSPPAFQPHTFDFEDDELAALLLALFELNADERERTLTFVRGLLEEREAQGQG